MALKQGAADYILKDRLQRLPSAIFSALDRSRMAREQSEIERKIRESEKQYFDLIQNLPAAVYTCDTQGRILLHNKAAVELWGCDPLVAKETWCGSTIMLDKEGRSIEPAACPMARAMAEGKSLFDEEIIIKRADGTRRHILSHPRPNFNSDGEIIGGTNMLIDITDRKKTEVETLTLVDNLQSRSNELAQFAYMISHHLRAPIARILGLASIFNYNPGEDNFIIEKITEATNELDDVVKDINLVISARNYEHEVQEFVEFNAEVEVITKSMVKEIKTSGARITTDFDACAGMVTVKRYWNSIISNFLSNAIKFRLPDTPLHIHLRAACEENFVCFAVKDNGRGIDLLKNSKDIFSIYKRFHKNPIPGKGVGLHLIKTQVEALGGRVEVESKLNEGAEFRFYLPMTHE